MYYNIFFLYFNNQWFIWKFGFGRVSGGEEKFFAQNYFKPKNHKNLFVICIERLVKI